MDGNSILNHILKRQAELRENPVAFFKGRIRDIIHEDIDTLMVDYIQCANNTPWTSEDTIYLFEYVIRTIPNMVQETIFEEYHEGFYHSDGTVFTNEEYVRWLQIITDYYKLINDNPESYIGKEDEVQRDFMKVIRENLDWDY